MTLADLRVEAARLSGFISPWDDRIFSALCDDWINRATKEVSLDLGAPTRYVYISAASPLPFPADAWEDGIISVKVDYDTTPRLLPLLTVGEMERRFPTWTSWQQDSTPQVVVYDPANTTSVLDIRPVQLTIRNYSIEYRAIPALLVNDNDVPLNNQLAAAHKLIAIKTAIYYCEYAVYQNQLVRIAQDHFAGRLQILQQQYQQYKSDRFADFGADVIPAQNPFFRSV